MRIAFIGCVRSSLRALSTLVNMSHKEIEVVAVVTKEESAVNADFADLAPLCIENDIPYHYEKSSERDQSKNFLALYEPDIIYCFGWSYLLDRDLLDLPTNGAIGFHPAPLPIGRGRHPIIWSLALGLKETASTFFQIDEGADSGPILSQVPIVIDPLDNATSLYQKILDVSQEQIAEFTVQLLQGTARFKKQPDSAATYWRKRTRSDGLINWRMQAEDVHNLVRALSPPYPGAECIYKGESFWVRESVVALESYPYFIEPGKILEVKNTNILVKCAGSSALWINQRSGGFDPDVGEYL